MLVRIRGGKSGVIEYLEDGIKNGRDFTRDELDNRICIDGNIRLTDTIINGISEKGKDNYYHITLAFKEKDLENRTIKDVYDDFKDKTLNAYDDSEYNIYAEIHQPKIKSYKDKKTGETIERLPHVHIVIPKKNLLTGKEFNPFGKFTVDEDLHLSIQESCNYKFDLISPYDSPREMISKASLISRYKGDNFKGANFELKSLILDDIHKHDIKTWDDFKEVLKNYGEVSETKTNSSHYLSIKRPNEKKNIRLKESCFSSKYIETRLYRDTRPSEKEVDKKVEEWVNRKSYEVKYVVKDSKVNRDHYYSLSENDKDEYLVNKRKNYHKKYNLEKPKKVISKIPFRAIKKYNDIKVNVPSFRSSLNNKLNKAEVSKNNERAERNDIRARRWPPNNQYDSTRTQFREIKTFAERTNSLSRLSKRDVVYGITGERDRITGVLSNNELQNVDNQREHQYQDVRWSGNWDGGRGGIKSVVTQIAEDEFQQSEINKDLDAYKEIRQNLKPEFLIENLARFNIEAKDYKSFTVKDGSYRIAVGKRNMNVSDFLTKHVGLTWDESKNILKDSYLKQLSFETEKEEENCIIFKPVMKYAGDYTMQDSIKVFNYLIRKEALEMSSADQLNKLRSLITLNEDNEILPKYKTVSFKDAYEQEKKAREVLKNSTLQEFKFSDLVAVKNEKKKQVDYKLNDGKTVFSDKGDRIKFTDKQPSNAAVLSGIKMAAEKFGSVKLNGTKEFKESVLREAAQNNVKVIFEPKSLNDQFMAMKEDFANKNENEIAQKLEPTTNLNDKTDLTTKSIEELKANSLSHLEKIQSIRSTPDYHNNVELKFTAKNEYDQLKDNITQLSKLTSENPFDENQSPESKILHGEFKNAQNAQQQESNKHQAVQVEQNREAQLDLPQSAISLDVVEAKQVKESQQAEHTDNSSQDMDKHSNRDKGFVTNFGSAPYKHNKENNNSFFVDLINKDGDKKTVWGVGLRSAISDNNVEKGDYVELENIGYTPVEIQEKIKDEQGKVIGSRPVTVERNEWNISVHPTEKLDDNQLVKIECENKLDTINELRSLPDYHSSSELKLKAKETYTELRNSVASLVKISDENPFREDQTILHNEFAASKESYEQSKQVEQNKETQVDFAKQVKEFQQVEQIDNSSQDMDERDMYADYEQYSQSEVSTAKAPIEEPKAAVETNSNSEIDSTASESNMPVDQYPKIVVEKINEIKDLYNEWQNDKRFTKRVNMATAQAGKLAHNFKALGINTNPFEGMERVADGFKKGLSEAEKPELKDSQVKIGYQIKGDGLQITHNDKPLQSSGVSDEFIEKLRDQDKFLNNFSKEQIKGGTLQLGELKLDALPKELHVEKNGDAVKQEEQAVVAKKGMSM